MAREPKYSIASVEPVGRYAVGIKWGDEHDSIFPFAHLRRSCPCEVCEREGSARRQPGEQASSLSGVLQVADASVMFRWADGHETLYLVEELRDLCACAACKGEPDYPITGR